MNIFIVCYIFILKNSKIKKINNYKLSVLDDNNDNKNNTPKKIYISKQYIYNIINHLHTDTNNYIYTDNYTNTDNYIYTDNYTNTDNTNTDNTNTNTDINNYTNTDTNNYTNTNIINSIMLGVNYAYPYENQTSNNEILNNINKNLYLQKQYKMLIDNKISDTVKSKIANEYLTMNITKYKTSIDSGGLYNDWLFNLLNMYYLI